MNANAQPRETESEMHQSLHAGSYARTQKIQHMQRNKVKQILNNLKTTKTRAEQKRASNSNKKKYTLHSRPPNSDLQGDAKTFYTRGREKSHAYERGTKRYDATRCRKKR